MGLTGCQNPKTNLIVSFSLSLSLKSHHFNALNVWLYLKEIGGGDVAQLVVADVGSTSQCGKGFLSQSRLSVHCVCTTPKYSHMH